MESIEILGCRVDAIDRAQAVSCIAALAQTERGALVVTIGVEMVMAAQHDTAYRALLNASKLNVCDTIGLLLASRARGGPLRERVTGVGLVEALAERSAASADLRLYFLGAADDTAERAAAELTRRFPGARIVGARNGYFAPAESGAIAARIAASGANVLLAGLGLGKQEAWIARFGAACGVGVGLGVGGSFDVFAGNVRRAPRALQQAGLEWAYRLVSDPKRWRRQLALPQFAIAELREVVQARKGTAAP